MSHSDRVAIQTGYANSARTRDNPVPDRCELVPGASLLLALRNQMIGNKLLF